ncbi:hypothetical protein MACH16_01100 [Marinomonas pontica]|uniref:Uncharacterized protein n=1 Tax=Marinomonas pontica TaxID=264739 RepID=A0ABN6WHZ8_9GAMM|nr:hypothetical protein MACH16_01100 [Marinomonas pontica]
MVKPINLAAKIHEISTKLSVDKVYLTSYCALYLKGKLVLPICLALIFSMNNKKQATRRGTSDEHSHH